MSTRQLSELEKETIKTLYKQNKTTVEIARELNRSQSGVERYLKRNNLYVKKSHRHKIPHSEDKNIVNLYLEGKTSIEIASLYDVTDNAILKLLNRLGIDTSNRSDIYSPVKHLNYFENIDTEKKAYLLGFITADGNITIPTKRPNSKVFQLEIQKRDREILELLASEIGLDQSFIREYSRSNPNRQPTVRIAFYSNAFCDHLAKYGIVKEKCHKTYLPAIPEELIAHYTRGLIDGDGSITDSQVTLFGNKKLLLDIKNIYIDKLGISSDSIKEYQASCYRLAIYQKDARLKLLEFLYKDATVFLSRKAKYSPYV